MLKLLNLKNVSLFVNFIAVIMLLIFSLFKKFIFFIKNLNIFISRPSWRRTKTQKKPSTPKRELEALQNSTFLHFFFFFASHPDPADKNKADPCRSMQIRFHNIDSLKSITTTKTIKTDMAWIKLLALVSIKINLFWLPIFN